MPHWPALRGGAAVILDVTQDDDAKQDHDGRDGHCCQVHESKVTMAA